ncbi:MAG: DUF2115 family protein [Methanobrevibacter sp.]|nr:DUF2115 family protein [Methanobrevibacter sp.]
MKSSELLEEIKENIQNYDINHIRENLKDEDINPISKQVSIFNLANYDEIMAKNIENEDDFEIDDEEIESMKNEIDLFFKGCSPESEDSFKKFIESICLYLSLIAKKPLHPVGMDFRDGKTVFTEEKDGKTVYYCDIKQRQAEIAKDYYTCKYCVCIPSELKE